ncbi:hypothetical protein [Cyclobacterium marinum]|uniref:hypothetical protein n=1 Tax=Cyclobacterium marinum TaxID=104 RepID=UPI0011EC9021|nr:hypothetical protein [Cyclobacterium marinum]MBI0400396.1 hypothetical protein [Cyclobacterium marinum]
MSKSISLLLGAGFSAPMGYPVGNQLNDLLLKCDGSDLGFSPDGSLCLGERGQKPNFGWKNKYEFAFDFCRNLIQHFNETRGYFDYEEFYDFFNYEAKDDPKVETLFNVGNYGYGNEKDLSQILLAIKNIYNQLVSHFLKDREGKSWYDGIVHKCGPTWPGYTGILNCLEKWSEEYLVNVHTLNHDLFFERLNYSDWLQGELCDGFEELGSPFFGDLSVESRRYKCRLQYYTDKYDKKFRLYKLHGSKDYGIFYGSNGAVLTPEKYVKTRWGVGFSKLYKEIQDENGELKYERCWVNYHADFLTGTTSKIDRYKEPLLFKILFEHFRINLKEAEKLIIVGYGGRDSEVNKMILENFDFKTKPTYVIDPFAGKEIKELIEKLGGTLVEKHLNDLTLEDVNE